MGQEVKKECLRESPPCLWVLWSWIQSTYHPQKEKKKEKIRKHLHSTCAGLSLDNRVNLLTLHCIEYHKPSRDGVTHVSRRTLPKFHGNGLAVYIKETPGES